MEFSRRRKFNLASLEIELSSSSFRIETVFCYCVVFPKDSIIDKQNLIFRWMAHGCISSNRTQEVEDVGDQIRNELVLRSFFQEVDTSKRQTTFKMHDLLHDLAQSIMENKIPGAQMERTNVSASNSKIRELYLSGHSVSSSSITLQASTVTNLTNYNRLRILKLNGARIEKLPSEVGKLKHLRYLDLSSSSIHTLPHTLCGLWNLQILILNCCYYLKSLPKHIKYMTNLRHILLEECWMLNHMPSRIGELTFLKTLSLLIVGHKIGNQLDELEFLNLGGKLEIKHLERNQNHMSVRKANLVNKPNLRDLVLHWEGHRISELPRMIDEEVLEALEPHLNIETLEIWGFQGSYFPLWMTKMENVTYINIVNCTNCLHLPVGDLPCLKSLHLRNLVALDCLEDESQGQSSIQAKFLSLKYLGLDSLPNLKGLLKEEVGEMFPSLQSLYINNCQLLILPPLSTSEKMIVGKCSCLTVSSLSKLENLTSLRLDFDDKMRTCILDNALGGLCNLKELRVLNAGEHHLPEKWFRGLRSLKELQIIHAV